MSTYRKIHGRSIQAVTTDPTGDVTEGQVWYNTSSDTFKTTLLTEAWASASSVITKRRTAASGGTQTANFIAGGQTPSYTAATEEYNGTGWSSGANAPSAHASGFGAGTLTAGLIFGGTTDPGGQEGITTTAEYDGSSWTTSGALNQKRWSGGSGAGTQTAALCSAGYNDGNVTNSEEYNGSSWTAGNAIDAGKRDHGQCGTQTASILFGGRSPPGSVISTVEEYDGTNYSSATSLPGTRANIGASGTQTAALGFGGYIDPGRSTNTFLYDGSSWSSKPNLATAVDGAGGSRGGTSKLALSSTGTAPPGLTSASEEFTSSANVITGAAFSSGGSANTARRQLGYTGAGTQNAFMVYGGFNGSMVNNSEEYGGATWTATPNLNTARGQNAGFGITTAAVACGGATPTIGGYTEEYNGSSWTTGNSMSTSRYEFGATGILTAGLALQGDQGPSTPFGVTCEEYDGTNWSSGGTASTARRTNSGVGTQTATITAGGQIPGPSATANVESYDGTSFSEVNNLNTARGGNAVMGGPAGATSSVVTGGNVPTQFSISEQWDGTSMVSGASMANDRSTHGAGGTSALGIVGLGQIGPAPPYGDADTEEYVGETSVLNVKTLTQS